MRKRSTIYPLSPSIQSKLFSIESDLISSHRREKLYEGSLAVAKIKSDYFFRYAKKNGVCVNDTGPLPSWV